MIKLPNNSIAKTTFGVTSTVFVLSLIFQLVVSNATGLKGEELAKLETEKSRLQKQISELEYQSFALSSLTVVEHRAQELGFEGIREAIATLPRLSDVQMAVLPTF